MKLLLIGYRSHGRVWAEIAESQGWEVGVLDDNA